MRRAVLRSLILGLLFAFVVRDSAAQGTPVDLVPTGASWSYFKGTAEPSPGDPAAWQAAGFNDTAWPSGSAPFWYGEAALFGGTGTEVPDMQNQYPTLYLRRRFQVASPASFESLQLTVRCDDGFVAWINGKRVASTNAPAGELAATSVATANATEPALPIPFPIVEAPGSLLVPGDNVLCIQVFNVSLGSSDIVLDASLTAAPRITGAPSIAAVTPAPGLVNTLDRITVTFSEPVQGVRAEDFLVNGASATGVEGSGTTYTFTFPRPGYGGVGVFWSTFHTIQDLENPPLRFDPAVPGSTWEYELIDPDGPSVATRQPPPGAALSALSQIEVTFNKAVLGIDASDLRVNGIAATQVSGIGAGPYLFSFPSVPGGAAQVEWAANHGITSDAFETHPFAGGSWQYQVVPGTTPPALTINEFMAENLTSYRDEDQDPEDWIEIRNPTGAAVDLTGWSLSNERDEPSLWVFPKVSVPANGYLIVFASAKDRSPTTAGARLHTNFKLNPTGGTLALYPPELPRKAVSELDYPTQGADYSYGRERNTGEWRYFKAGSPGAANPASSILDAVEPVHFSVERGFFAAPFQLSLSCPTPGAFIRFTTNGSPPTELEGFLYTNSISIRSNRVIRAAAFRSNSLPSAVVTHTYLVGLSSTRLRLPALSLVSATNNLFGRNGIMEVSPRNTTKRGAAWERPVSVELIRPEDNGGFQVDCGLRLQGGDYVRGQYNYRSTALPFSKYSFRLYFRGEYGKGRLEYPWFPETTQQSFDTVVLRAGMNDHSNPYLLDEFVRTLARDCTQPAAVGTFVHLFLNGVYKGYYNPCERIDVDFLRAYHGGGDKWDVMAQFGEVREGDATAWTTLRNLINTRDLSQPANYRDVANRIDLVNFIDYLCPLIYVDNDDWPHNNWRAARERVAGGRYRFYVWDAEWSFGTQNGHGVTWNTIQNQLSSTSPPWGGSDIQRIFIGLRKAPEFRQLFADRVHRHFFNGGALTDDRIRRRYSEVTNRLNGVVTGFNNVVATSWIPNRRKNVLLHMERAGLIASSNAPALSRHGGRVPAGYPLTITNVTGTIYFTTNGTDPRVEFTGELSPDAQVYTKPLTLSAPLLLRARSLFNTTNWSALTEASFEVARITSPLRITELMYNPPGDDAFEFLELSNLGDLPANVSGFTFEGIQFRFPEPSPVIPAGARWILANNARPADFAARYPGITVAGWFDGSLSNGGEQIRLLTRDGDLVTSVTYGDSAPWPTAPDGVRGSLEFIAESGAPDDPASWQASIAATGSPGSPNPTTSPAGVRLWEISPSTPPSPDWIELRNTSASSVALGGWSLSDQSDPKRFVFPQGTTLAAGAFLRVWCDTNTVAGEYHAGFELDADGETLALYDPTGSRADAVTYGSVPRGFTLGRSGVDPAAPWVLCEPTPLAQNEAASLATPARLSVNEWLANPAAGDEDWIELHNADPNNAVALRGLHIATSNAVHQLPSLSFIGPSGFVVLHADERPLADHLPFKLPAAAGRIAVLDDVGSELSAVTYRGSQENVSVGRFPDGSDAITAFPLTASPGTSNYVTLVGTPRIHEWMALNEGAVVDATGRVSDWLELHHPGSTAFDLSGTTLTVNDGPPFVFPEGSRLEPNARLVLWADPLFPASTSSTPPLRIGRGLPSEGATLTLRNRSGQILDQVSYGQQIANRSAGETGSGLALLTEPTPGSPNAARHSMAPPSSVRINEWSARSGSRDDFVEVFNPAALPVDLGGCTLTDDPSIAGLARFPVSPLSFVPAGGYIRWLADGREGQGPDHLNFTLAGGGETVRLYSPARDLIDSIDFGAQAEGVAGGRFPDGADSLARFPESRSPGRSNWLPHPGVVINELLAHTDPPLEDAVELLNPSARTTDLTGWYLSDDVDRLRKFRLPAGTLLEPGGYRVLYEPFFNLPGNPTAFTFNAARGGDVWLSEANPDGSLSGRRAHASFSATANGESFGRHRTSVGWDFAPQSRRTFGKDLPASVAEFRQGGGLPNAYPRVGPVVISEVAYRPLAVSAVGEPVEIPEDEYLELTNTGSQPVTLFDARFPTNTWRIRGAVQFDFPSGAVLAAGERVVVVAFAPTNLAALASFQTRRSAPTNVRVFGPFSGRLSNEEDDLRLEQPDTPQAPPHPDAGLVPYLLVEHVHYRSVAPWPVEPATDGSALHRRRAAEYANDPANWFAGAGTPGGAPQPPATDRDLDGIPNDWETAHGLNPDDPADAQLDPDLDTLSNLAEFLAGTDPKDAQSALRLTLTLEVSAGPSIRFRAFSDRSYSLLRRSEPDYGAWEKVSDIPALPFDRDVSLRIDTGQSSGQFFQLITPATP